MNVEPSARTAGRWRRPVPWLVAGLLLATAALPAGASVGHLVRFAPLVGVGRALPLAGNLTANFSVNLTDAPSFDPAYLNVTANLSANATLTVQIQLHNNGTYAHTFTLADQAGTLLNRSWTPAELDSYLVAHPPLANVSLPAGGTGWANVTFNASKVLRSYEFVSTVPYQFQAGMFGFLNIAPGGPAYLLEDNTTSQFRFVPDVLAAAPTAHGATTLHVKVTNLGSIPHSFTVYPQPNETVTSLGQFAKNPPLVNQSVPIPGPKGASTWANFTVPGPGVYEFVCMVLGHFASGMFGFLYVGVLPPAPSAPPSTAIVDGWILVGSAALLGIGAVLAVAAALSGRLPRAPPAHGGPRP